MNPQGKNLSNLLDYSKKKCLILLASGMLSLVISLLPNERAAARSTRPVFGTYGQLIVRGQAVIGTCEIEVDGDSLYQEVDLGQVSTSQLQSFGDQSAQAFFSIKFFACDPAPSLRQDLTTGNLYFDPLQPIVSIRFIAPVRKENPELIKLNGVNGAALRIYDAQHRSVTLGQIGTPQFLGATNQELRYSVVVERTAEPLTRGKFSAVANFVLFYE